MNLPMNNELLARKCLLMGKKSMLISVLKESMQVCGRGTVAGS